MAAFNLRPAIVGVSPLLSEIMDDLGLSPAAGGMVTTLMVVCLGLLAPAVPFLTRRIGVERTLLAALLVLAVGLVVRSMGGPVLLYTGAAACGAAIAVMNVVMPGLVKRHFPERAGLMTGVYVTGLVLGASAAAAYTVPIERALDLGWRPAIAVSVLTAVAAIVLWAPQALRRTTANGPVLRLGPLLRSRTTWLVTGFMGLQSLTFYMTLAWLPTIFQDAGYTAATGGLLLGLTNVMQVATSLLAPVLAAKARSQAPYVLAAALLTLGGYLGILLAPTTLPWLWMVVLGLGQGASLALALLIITLRAPDPESVVSLSAVAQTFGYLVAALGPYIMGALFGLTAGWTVPLLVGAGVCLLQLIVGVLAGRPRAAAEASPQ